MPLPARILAPLLALASSTALARDLPADLVQTRDDFYLKGAPKVVITQNTAGVTEQKFDKDGILVSQMTGGSGQEMPFMVELKKGRLVAVLYSPSRRADAPGATPMQVDARGRATILRESELRSAFYKAPVKIALGANAVEGHLPSYVRTVSYDADRQVHTIYQDRQLLLRLAFDFGPDGHLRRVSCLAGECGNAAEYEYGDAGPVMMKTGVGDVTYRYEDGVLVEEASLDKRSGTTTRIYYGDYAFDECGNWTRRVAFVQPASDPARKGVGVFARKIDYYTPCQ